MRPYINQQDNYYALLVPRKLFPYLSSYDEFEGELVTPKLIIHILEACNYRHYQVYHIANLDKDSFIVKDVDKLIGLNDNDTYKISYPEPFALIPCPYKLYMWQGQKVITNLKKAKLVKFSTLFDYLKDPEKAPNRPRFQNKSSSHHRKPKGRITYLQNKEAVKEINKDFSLNLPLSRYERIDPVVDYFGKYEKADRSWKKYRKTQHKNQSVSPKMLAKAFAIENANNF